MQLWTFLHIVAMFAAVTVVVGAEWWATYAIRRRDLGALRAFYRISSRADMIGTVLFILGIAFGLIAAVVIGWNLLEGWLVLAYVLVALTIVVGFANAPYLERVKKALEAQEGDEPGPELTRLLRSPRPVIGSIIGAVAVVIIIWDMVYKPTF